MEKTLILCDSASDIPPELEAGLPLRIMNIGIEMYGRSYRDREDVTSADIYREVARHNGADGFPHTAHSSPLEFYEEYQRLAEEGYQQVVSVWLNSKGSGTFETAQLAWKGFCEDHPQAASRMQMYFVDSGTYSLGIGWWVLKAAKMVEEGVPAQEIARLLEDQYAHQTTLLSMYSLDYARKSGRLGSVAAFVGELLGLKPQMTIAGENRVVDKVRGDRNVIPKLADIFFRDAEDPYGPYVVAYGDDRARGEELAAEIQSRGGRAPDLIAPVGPCVAINSGPKVVGMAYRSKNYARG